MRKRLAVCAAMLVAGAVPAHAHRLDEYLQATTILVGTDRVRLQLRLTPGVAVARSVLAAVDVDGNGVISDAEQEAYARRVLHDISLAVDGAPLTMQLVDRKFGTMADMRDGRGEIVIDVEAAIPHGAFERRLTFDNRHQRAISDYLVNALVPRDPGIHIARQVRSYEQASYALDYSQASAGSAVASPWWHSPYAWLLLATALCIAQLVRSGNTPKRELETGAGQA